MKNLFGFIATAGFISVLSSLSPTVLAQANAGMQVDVSRCVVLVNPEQRHQCFDDITAHLRSNTQAVPVSAAPVSAVAPLPPENLRESPVKAAEASKPAAEVANETAVREYGLDTTSARVADNAQGDAELQDTIAKLEEREPGRWLVTLASGQVWYQETSQRIRLKEGMSVRIYPSSFGSSYRLAAEQINGVIQVRRVK